MPRVTKYDSYPRLATVRCEGCGVLVEAKFMNYRQYNRKIFCGQPCGAASKRQDAPQILKIYKTKKRESDEV